MKSLGWDWYSYMFHNKKIRTFSGITSLANFGKSWRFALRTLYSESFSFNSSKAGIHLTVSGNTITANGGEVKENMSFWWTTSTTKVPVTMETNCCDFEILNCDLSLANKRAIFVGIAGYFEIFTLTK